MINQKKLYIVDDDPVICSLLAELLNIEQVEISLYQSWTVAKKSILNGGTPNILLIDLQMPETDGISAIKDLNQEFPNHQTKIILMSANDDTDKLLTKANLEIHRIIKKPFNIMNLKNLLSELISCNYSPP